MILAAANCCCIVSKGFDRQEQQQWQRVACCVLNRAHPATVCRHAARTLRLTLSLTAEVRDCDAGSQASCRTSASGTWPAEPRFPRVTSSGTRRSHEFAGGSGSHRALQDLLRSIFYAGTHCCAPGIHFLALCMPEGNSDANCRLSRLCGTLSTVRHLLCICCRHAIVVLLPAQATSVCTTMCLAVQTQIAASNTISYGSVDTGVSMYATKSQCSLMRRLCSPTRDRLGVASSPTGIRRSSCFSSTAAALDSTSLQLSACALQISAVCSRSDTLAATSSSHTMFAWPIRCLRRCGLWKTAFPPIETSSEGYSC